MDIFFKKTNPACLWGAEKRRGSPVWRTRSPVSPSCHMSVPSSSLARSPCQSVVSSCAWGPQGKREKEMTWPLQTSKACPGVCLGIFLALSHLIPKWGMTTTFIDEKMRLGAQSWEPFSSLCPQSPPPVPRSGSCLIRQRLPALHLQPWPSSC